ncbi:hypothetical protein AGDE_05844 [Angomonas deanei]|uniref:Transmembrane protein n=1 Tax=Angomonas deanei TaxID=59799 RepID=A0A7G2C9U7_9TRYP|nr:hypothetical protein AGDE_05844 [Angomonas deanei]CAD2214792.1 hypothetical protein, conserved [Angomonas deanei]|eukprot:EPY38088.1 hypothetical protein AGDE_05844 [Angomonas deanei]
MLRGGLLRRVSPISVLKPTAVFSFYRFKSSGKPEQKVAKTAEPVTKETPLETPPDQLVKVHVVKPRAGWMRKMFASWQQGVVASLGAVMGIGFLMLLFYDPVKEDTVHHTAVVASEALNDVRLRSQAIQLSKDVVSNVLVDPKSLDLVVALVAQLLAQEQTKIAVSSLLQSLFEDHYTQEITKKFVLGIVRDPWIQEQIHLIVKDQMTLLLQDEDIKRKLTALLVESASTGLEDPTLHFTASRAIRSWTSAAMTSVMGTSIVALLGYLVYELR